MPLAMTEKEASTVDSKVEQMLDWAKGKQAEAEQLAFDSARLMSCTGERMDRLASQGFFKRCWTRFNGEAGSMERANTRDLMQMQKTSLRYINMLQEQQLIMAHSMISLKNNLLTLAVKEEETRNLVALLAQKTLERFKNLESRVDHLEISTNLQGWLLGLEEREYDERIPTEYMRMFQVINDFYTIKSDSWNYNDLMFMRKAIRTVGLNPKKKLSLNIFIDSLADEIQHGGVGFFEYQSAICKHKPGCVVNYSSFVVEEISSPVFSSMHGLKTQFMDRLDVVEELSSEMKISPEEALKRLLRRSIANMGVNLDYEFTLAETAIEILGCIRLAEKLATPLSSQGRAEDVLAEVSEDDAEEISIKSTSAKVDVSKLTMSPWRDAGISLEDLGRSSMFRSHVFRESVSIAHDGAGRCVLLWNDAVWISEDLNSWEKKHDFPFSSGKIVKAGGKLFCISNDRIISSDSGDVWHDIDVPRKYSGECVYYDDVYHNGKTWFFFGKYRVDYNYTKKGFFKDSTETSSYWTHVVYVGEDFSSLRAYSLVQDFPMYESVNIAYACGRLAALLRSESDSSDICVAVSDDGFSWKRFPIDASEEYYSDISSYEEAFFVEGYNSLYSFSEQTGELRGVSTNISLLGRREYVYKFPEHGIAFLAGYGKEDFYVTNDFKAWAKIDNPSDGILSLSYSTKQIVIVDDKGKIKFRDFH